MAETCRINIVPEGRYLARRPTGTPAAPRGGRHLPRHHPHPVKLGAQGRAGLRPAAWGQKRYEMEALLRALSQRKLCQAELER